MADQEFVDPSGWRVKEQAAKLRDAAVAASAHVEDQLSALSRVRRAERELENTSADDPQRDALVLELRSAQEALSVAQSASELKGRQAELKSDDLGATVAELVEQALAKRPAQDTAFVRIEDLDDLVRAVVREELAARAAAVPVAPIEAKPDVDARPAKHPTRK